MQVRYAGTDPENSDRVGWRNCRDPLPQPPQKKKKPNEKFTFPGDTAKYSFLIFKLIDSMFWTIQEKIRGAGGGGKWSQSHFSSLNLPLGTIHDAMLFAHAHAQPNS